MSTEPKCPACGKLWKEHRGCIAMCVEIERLTAALAEAQAVVDAAAAYVKAYNEVRDQGLAWKRLNRALAAVARPAAESAQGKEERG